MVFLLCADFRNLQARRVPPARVLKQKIISTFFVLAPFELQGHPSMRGVLAARGLKRYTSAVGILAARGFRKLPSTNAVLAPRGLPKSRARRMFWKHVEFKNA